jgi:hypothetical protein
MTDLAHGRRGRIEIHPPGRNEVHASWSFRYFNLTPFDIRIATSIHGRPMRIEDERDQVQTSD